MNKASKLDGVGSLVIRQTRRGRRLVSGAAECSLARPLLAEMLEPRLLLSGNDQAVYAVAEAGPPSEVALSSPVGNGATASPESQVSTAPSLRTFRSAVARNSSGQSVVVWMTAGADPGGWIIKGQRFDAAGQAQGGTFGVGSFNWASDFSSETPGVAMDASGRFVVTWQSWQGEDGSEWGVYAQRFDANAQPLGGAMLVNFTTVGSQAAPVAAMRPDGAFVIAWQSSGQDGSGWGIFAQRFDAAGVMVGDELLVNTSTTNDQLTPAVAIDNSGNFVIAWQSWWQDGSEWGIHAQRFGAAGAKLGSELAVNTVTTGTQDRPTIAMMPDGRFMIVWESNTADGNDWAVAGRCYSATGQDLGGELVVNSTTQAGQYHPAVTADGTDGYAIAWYGYGGTATAWGIYGCHVTAAGVPAGSEYRISAAADTGDSQEWPAVAAGAGNALVAWCGNYSDVDAGDIYGQLVQSGGQKTGDSFRVNAQPVVSQRLTTTARSATGQTIVAWQAWGLGDGWDIYARVSDAQGQFASEPFRVNTTVAHDQSLPSIACDAAGNFVVVWQGWEAGGNDWDVYGQRFDAAGQQVGLEFLINVGRGGYQGRPVVSMWPTGEFLVAWEENGDIYSRRYSAGGVPQVSVARVNTRVDGTQYMPAVATGPGGAVIAWQTDGQEQSWDIECQRLDLAGLPVGEQMHVNTTANDSQEWPAVAMAPDGGFLVAWRSSGQDGSEWGIYGQRFNAGGQPVGGEFRANTRTWATQEYARAGFDAAGNSLIIWQNNSADGSDWGIYGQMYDPSGVAVGREFRVNTTVDASQYRPSLAMSGRGEFTIAWENWSRGLGSWEIFSRDFRAAGGSGSVQGIVWNDANGDGIRQTVETGIAGVAVGVYTAGGFAVASTVTDSAGSYGFDGLLSGTLLSMRVSSPSPSRAFSPRDVGGNEATDSDVDAAGMAAVTLTAANPAVAVDAGLRLAIAPWSSTLTGDELAVTGTEAIDVIDVQWKSGNLVVTCGGESKTLDATVVSSLAVRGLGGDDVITIGPGVIGATLDGGTGDDLLAGGDGNDTLTGGTGHDVMRGGEGDDLFQARDEAADEIDGGNGYDTIYSDSFDRVLNVEAVNPFEVAPDNQTMHVRVLVMNFDPVVPSRSGQRTWQIFGWTDPRRLASDYEASVERASGGGVQMEIVDWMDINSLVPRADGYVYSPDEYVNIWSTTRQFHTPDGADNARLMNDYGVPQRVSSGEVDEVWVMAPPGGGADWEASMLGPRSFFINGGVYSTVPSTRPFALYGFNYERGVDCMLENTLHRMENHMSRSYNGWNLGDPQTNWDRFTANIAQSPITPGVGSCHYAPNSSSDYDWGNERIVQTNADDWLNYPNLTGATLPMNCQEWTNGGTRDTFTGHHNWWLEHLPRASGTIADGRLNNWWRYLYDYDHYDAGTGAPKPASVACSALDLYNLGGTTYRFQVTYEGPTPVSMAGVGDGDVVVFGPNGYTQAARLVAISDPHDGNYRVVTYEITAPGGSWDAGDRGAYTVTLPAGQVTDTAGQSMPPGVIGAFSVRAAGAAPLVAEGDPSLLLRFDGDLTGQAGETAIDRSLVTYAAGILGQGAYLCDAAYIRYPVAGNINPLAGTVEFWIKPNWNGNDSNSHLILGVGSGGNAMQIQTDAWNQGVKVLMFGDDPDTPEIETNWESNRYAAAGISEWQAGQWHHVAATWDSDQRFIRVYLDGVLSADWSGCPRIGSYSTDTITIGSSGGAPLQAKLDELCISGRARSNGEILVDYNQGLAISSLLLSQLPASIASGEESELHATGSNSLGITRDFTRQVRWSSSNPGILAVDEYGRLRAIAAGSAVITAALDTLSGTAALTVSALSRPSATLSVSDVTVAGGTALVFTVTYAGNTVIDAATMDSSDIRVVGSEGFSQFAALVGVASADDGRTRTATYRITPPGGSWNMADAGVYIVSLTHNQVGDTSGIFALADVLGTFHAMPFTLLDAAGRLSMAGTPAADSFAVSRSGDTVVASRGSWQASYPASQVQYIVPPVGAEDMLDVNCGNYTLAGVASSTSQLRVGGSGALELLNSQSLAALAISGSGRISFAGGAQRHLIVAGLTLADGALLDLADSDLIVSYTAGSPAGQVQKWLRNGRLGTTPAIITSQSGKALGWVDNALIHIPSFAGQTLTGFSQVLVKNTFVGDTNFDGKVDQQDYPNIIANMGRSTGAQWFLGDLNYDGVVSVDDLAEVSANLGVGVAFAAGPVLPAETATSAKPVIAKAVVKHAVENLVITKPVAKKPVVTAKPVAKKLISKILHKTNPVHKPVQGATKKK